jgi:hypothetical protein
MIDPTDAADQPTIEPMRRIHFNSGASRPSADGIMMWM